MVLRAERGVGPSHLRRDIDWPHWLNLPAPGDIVDLPSIDGEVYSYDVKRVNYHPLQDKELTFAVIETEAMRLGSEAELIEEMDRMKADGWR